MYRHRSFKKPVAAFLLLLFILGSTPRQLLHDVITGHKHTYVKSTATVHVQAPVNTIQCNWNPQTVISPFIDEPVFSVSQPAIVYTSYINHYTYRYYSTENFFSSLRGPPVCSLIDPA